MEKEMKKDVKWEQVLFCCSNCSIPADSDPNWVCPLCGFPSCSAKLFIDKADPTISPDSLNRTNK